jgi:predicted transposase YdaD
MRTNTLFYQLFNTFRSLLFELIEQPPSDAEGYEFVSVEVKEKAFGNSGGARNHTKFARRNCRIY